MVYINYGKFHHFSFTQSKFMEGGGGIVQKSPVEIGLKHHREWKREKFPQIIIQ